ncbi:hypothetical protein [Salsuginibacillus kocurii]|uniref:hypothetical protein n=1 Tax=Salsuginibacillus kocurii TaxID=427078 RepID=UPI00037E6509|nr:hypothetical protein [Salsuginibacillus kocurii]
MIDQAPAHTLKKRLFFGLLAGTAASIIYGLYLQMAGMVASAGFAVGEGLLFFSWMIHLLVSWNIGLGFALLTYITRKFYILAGFYGVLLWGVLPLQLFPIGMGAGLELEGLLASQQVNTLFVYLSFAFVVAVFYERLVYWEEASKTPPPPKDRKVI